MRIEYPVVIDNDYAIWRAFNNRDGLPRRTRTPRRRRSAS
jgi:hypothetical protein